LLVGSSSGAVRLRRAGDGALVRELAPDTKTPVVGAGFADGGALAITAELGNTVTIWDVASGKAVRKLHEPGRVARGAFVSPDGKTFLYGGRTLSLVDVRSGKTLREYTREITPRDASITVAFARDGKTFLTEDGEYSMSVWRTEPARKLRSYEL